jgi:flagellar hook-basal body complex protein FliE
MNPIHGLVPPPRPTPPFTEVSQPGKRIGDSRSLQHRAETVDSSAGLGGFAEVLVDQVRHVNTMQHDANDMVHSLLTGGSVNEAEVLTSVQKADLAFRMLLQIRNKLVEAYREIQQIQI